MKTILLDIDDTLLDFNACAKEAMKQTFKIYDLTFTEEIFEKYMQIDLRLWKEYENGDIRKETVLNARFVELFKETKMDQDGKEFEHTYQNFISQQCHFIPGAREILKYLSEKYDVYVVTNAPSTTQIKRLKIAGIDKYVKDVFISDLIGHNKPKAEFFDYCFKHIKDFNKDETIIIGDSLTADIQGGNNAGIQTCWFNPKNSKNDICTKCDHIIYNLEDIKKIL